MTDEKITEVLKLYQQTAEDINSRNDMNLEMSDLDGLQDATAVKIRSMIPPCYEFLREGRREKLMRWLGFMQGAWWAAGVYTVDELKRHNMPPGEEFQR